MAKILSVCIPTYNMEELLARCLDSFIIDQEYMNLLEVIVVNDGSKDESLHIMQSYASRYPNTFIVVDKPNGNYGSCVNAALKVATGEYFRICDADDHYDKQALSFYIRLLLDTDADLTINPYITCNYDGTVIYQQDTNGIELNKKININDIKWKEYKYNCYRAMHCIAVKTKILTTHNYKQLEGISYTDTQFVFYATLYAQTCIFFVQPLYIYYLGRDGQTMSVQSMIKNNMHFYKNGITLLEEFTKLPTTIEENKRYLLFDSIFKEFYCFMDTILFKMSSSAEQQILLRGAVERSKSSNLKCELQETLEEDIYFKFWYRYHFPRYILLLCRNYIHKWLIRRR